MQQLKGLGTSTSKSSRHLAVKVQNVVLQPRASTVPPSTSSSSIVNSWTEWQPLKEIIVGRCEMSCMMKTEPAFKAKLKEGHALSSSFGRRAAEAIEDGERELAEFINVLEGKFGVVCRRPEVIDWNMPIKTPDFEVPNGNTSSMPRDVLLTVGNEIVEATMSLRGRFFEYRCYRSLLNEYFERDPDFKWTSAPKPSMNDSMYRSDYLTSSMDRTELVSKRIYCTNETEPIWDAADIMRFGKDMFVLNSFTTNRKGYEWLKRHFNQRGLRVHFVDFPDDLAPMHIDTNFVPLNGNTIMLNPKRPPRPWLMRLLQENGWKTIVGTSNGLPVHPLSHCSEWLSCNVLSIDEKHVAVEAQETKMHELLSKNGFEPVLVPLRSIAQFGGAFHCCTADVRREGDLKSYFPHIDELEAAGKEYQFAPYGAEEPEAYKTTK
ncbi:hypothetical protein CEUSTIGMA_g2084.t1 [Chlamydomonas eustigma]|uniref:Glycine amidinotransferase, mitochondrial n=1 Tax=Chlamydomonas eustigma TaxID=1157962 RepID=A0A250WV57_9CHLO|nr:hypothetical protein CEUSTIGMA_g2084.t1 [Chlamydomonas eustigma]|eukprot:GAX74636.1 hypothetical protein CEUSTIGMA_g2084.t1 [Chlamydomonas eustigma]